MRRFNKNCWSVSQARELYACLHALQLGVRFCLRCAPGSVVCSSSFVLPYSCPYLPLPFLPVFPLFLISSLSSGARSCRVRVPRRIFD